MNTGIRFLAAAALAAVFALVPGAGGTEISANDAARAAKAWVERGLSMGKMSSGRAIAGVDELEVSATGARLRVVRFEGGGYVVLSADDLVEPVLAFSETGEGIDPDGDNPFWVLLGGDIAAREAAAGIVRGKARKHPPRRISAASGAAREKWSALLAADGGGSGGATPKIMQGVPSISEVRVDPFVQSKWGQSTSDN